MTARLQIVLWAFLFALWIVGCTVTFSGPQQAPAPSGTHIPCATLTTMPITGTTGLTTTVPLSAPLPLSPTITITTTIIPTATGIITLTMTPPPTITITTTVTATVQPTTTLMPTRALTATRTVTGTPPPLPTARGTVTGTLTPISTLTPTRTITATTPATRVTPATPPSAPQPGQSPTATLTRAPTATATRPAAPAPTNTPAPSPSPTLTRAPVATATTTRAPTPTGGPPPATPTPAPANTVYVRSQRSFARDTTYFVVGEVVNNTPGPVFRVRVTGTFYNASNQVIATQETYAYLAQTGPDQRNPFKFQVDNPANDISRYELTVAWEDISVVTYQDLIILSQEVRQTNGPEVAGQVQNDFDENLGSIVVVVALYDQAGEVVDVYQGTPQATQLAPGDVSPFAVQMAPDQTFASFSVQAQGKRAIFF